jgi:hypothetical protein
MLLEQYKQMAGMVKRMGGIKGLFGKGVCMDVVACAGLDVAAMAKMWLRPIRF